MTENRNTLDALTFHSAREDELAKSQVTSSYAMDLFTEVVKGRQYVQDPDEALRRDPNAYRKIETEPTIIAKIQKRAGRVASADWSVTSQDQRYSVVAKTVEQLLRKVRRFTISLRTLSKNSTIQGRALARINGEIVEQQLDGDNMVRNWWAPTKLTNVSKQRTRINISNDEEIEAGDAPYYWAIQDLATLKWYRLGGADASIGLRPIDYVEAIYAEDETDLGQAHGLMKAMDHKWFMLSRATMYALEGAETWAFGKTIVTTPRDLISSSKVGSPGVTGFEANQVLIQKLANHVTGMMRNNTVVITEGQTIETLARPDSGSEAVTALIEMLSDDFAELILGRRKGENHEWDIDPDIIVMDRLVLEDAVNNGLVRAIIAHNMPNYEALGWSYDELVDNVKWTVARQSVLDTEVSGRNLMMASSLGVPVNRNDIFRMLSLTPIEDGHPDAVHAPQAGQPISGAVMPQLDNDPLIDQAPTVEPPAPPGAPTLPPPSNIVRPHI